ncbi:MAG TPA: hypothetical protein VFE10_15010 [Phenylobacterium sp.]|jgi:hypothetical protein|nr:hypothetical protein [Phenylobacterium sp.]
MPRYFFDVRDGGYIPDPVGHDFADLEAARLHAVVLSAGLLSGNPAKFWDGEEWQLEVCDHERLILFILTFMATNAPHLPSRRLSGAAADRAPG